MLRQDYGCSVYRFNPKGPVHAELVTDIGFTVEGPDEEALGRAADERMDKIKRRLKDDQYLDDVMWSAPREVVEESW